MIYAPNFCYVYDIRLKMIFLKFRCSALTVFDDRAWRSAYKDRSSEESDSDDAEWREDAVTVDDRNTVRNAAAGSHNQENVARLLGSRA